MIALPLLTGCAFQSAGNKAINASLSTAVQTQALNSTAFHAQLHDIPVPVGFQLTTTQTTDASMPETPQTCSNFRFSGKQSVEQLARFYTQEMETQGWKVDSFKADEALLVCKKPAKRCTISLRTQQGTAQGADIYLLVKLSSTHADEQPLSQHLSSDEHNDITQAPL